MLKLFIYREKSERSMVSQHEFMATNRFAARCGTWRHCSSYCDLQKAVESASGCNVLQQVSVMHRQSGCLTLSNSDMYS